MTLLSLQNINKNYGGVKALSDVSLDINGGEVHSIVGENGAGKSTLMKIISGVTTPTGGKMTFLGSEKKFKNPRDTEKLGIYIVHQEPVFFPDLTVLENIFLGQELVNKLGLVDKNRMKKVITPYLDRFGVEAHILDSLMKDLSIGTQQLILITKGVYQKSRLLILDEPTSILSYEESENLFSIIATLSNHGVSILYISHRIQEVIKISHKITVLKDGFLVKTLENKKVDSDEILLLMSGKDISLHTHTDVYNDSDTEEIFRAKNISSGTAFKNISFALHRKQILGLYGLIGAGRTEIAQAIIGEKEYTGELFYNKKSFFSKNAKDAYRQGIVYLPEDRIVQGLFSIETIRINMTAGLVEKLCKKNIQIDFVQEKAVIDDAINKYSIKVNDIENNVASLSGGNQQKVLLSRCLLHKPRILILDEPTRGIDVKTKVEIYMLINKLLAQGTTILLISSELSEIISLTNKIIVMHEGNIVDCFVGDSCTEQNILKAALNSA